MWRISFWTGWRKVQNALTVKAQAPLIAMFATEPELPESHNFCIAHPELLGCDSTSVFHLQFRHVQFMYSQLGNAVYVHGDFEIGSSSVHSFLNVAKFLTVNVMASLLPRLRFFLHPVALTTPILCLTKVMLSSNNLPERVCNSLKHVTCLGAAHSMIRYFSRCNQRF